MTDFQCACASIKAVDAIRDIQRFVAPTGDLVEYVEHSSIVSLVDHAAKRTISAIDDASKVCNVNLEDAKAQINWVNATFKNKAYITAYDHALEAQVKFEQKICKTEA